MKERYVWTEPKSFWTNNRNLEKHKSTAKNMLKRRKKMKIILGPASQHLGEKIAEILGTQKVNVAFKIFPDGESYVRLEGVVRDEVAIVQTTSPPQDSRMVQLALMVDAAKRSGAKKITAVVPYLAYARPEKAFS